jgi:hypothetical protein
VDGSPVQPSSLKSTVPNWAPGDVITLSRSRQLRVVQLRDDDADKLPVLVVENVESCLGLPAASDEARVSRTPRGRLRDPSLPKGGELDCNRAT